MFGSTPHSSPKQAATYARQVIRQVALGEPLLLSQAHHDVDEQQVDGQNLGNEQRITCNKTVIVLQENAPKAERSAYVMLTLSECTDQRGAWRHT